MVYYCRVVQPTLKGITMLQANELSAAKPTMPPPAMKADVTGDKPVKPKPAERGRQVVVVRTKKHGYQAMLRGPDGATIGEPKTGLTREQAEALTVSDFEPKPKPKAKVKTEGKAAPEGKAEHRGIKHVIAGTEFAQSQGKRGLTKQYLDLFKASKGGLTYDEVNAKLADSADWPEKRLKHWWVWCRQHGILIPAA